MTSPPRICVLGSINMDLVVQAPRFAHPGETVLGGAFETHPGGKGANQAIAAAKLGAHASLIGCIGGDAYGREMIECISSFGIDLTGLEVREGSATGVGVITIDRNTGENMIIVASGANMKVTAQQIERAAPIIEQSQALLLQFEVPMRANTAAARVAKSAGVPVIVNAAPAKELPHELLECTDVLIVNRAEAALLNGFSPDDAPLEMFAGLCSLGIDHVVMTLGPDGALVNLDGTCLQAFAPEVDAVDSVGAGDAFTGAFAAAMAGERPVDEALRHAIAAGSLAVTRAGAIPSLPEGDSVRKLAETIDLVTVERGPVPAETTPDT